MANEEDPPTFGDVVKVLDSAETQSLGIAGQFGLVAGAPPHLLGIEDEPTNPQDAGQYAVDINGSIWALCRPQFEVTYGPKTGWHMNRITHPGLFQKLRPHWRSGHTRRIYCGFGWAEILDSCHEALRDVDPGYRLGVVKEKWGELKMNAGPEIYDTNDPRNQATKTVLEQARLQSIQTCEWCGLPGELRELNWERTLCDPCTSAMVESGEEHGRRLEI